jgi:hypothetical protein
MNSRIVRASLYGLGMTLLVSSMSTRLLAALVAVPEIDGGTISTGLAGLAAATLILRARFRSRRRTK